MKVAIINQHTLNYGDDLAGISLVEGILKKFGEGTEISVFYRTKGEINFEKSHIKNFPEVQMKEIGVLNIFLYLLGTIFGMKWIKNQNLKKYVDSIVESEYIFVSPCGANIGIYTDWAFLLAILIAIRAGKKPVFHNNTIGKSRSLLFDIIAKYVLKNSELYVRELASFNYLSGKNLNPIRAVDSAFMFNSRVSEKDFGKYLLFVPTQMDNWHPDFKGKSVENMVVEKVIKPMVSYAVENGFEIKILEHLYGHTSEDNLLLYYEKEIKKLGLEKTQIIKCKNCYEYDEYIAKAKFVVSMRYHGVVMSVKNKVPFLSLAYENKMNEVTRYSGYEKLNVNIKDLKDCKTLDLNALYREFLLIDNNSDYLRGIAEQCLNQLEFRVK